MLIIGSAPGNFYYLLKTKESASLAWLFLHTGRWPACIESVFYWICGSRIFSLETLSHVPCFVTASRCSCSLMCLALSQHHAALALSCALLCLSITLLLLSHVPCFVSASRCSCSLMCLALSQHHAALALSCALLCLSITLLLLSHVPCFVSASRCTAYHAALILMCLALSQYCFLKCFALSQHP